MRGDERAPITIVAFIDFECPYSQKGYSIFADVMRRYEPVARVVFKHMPVELLHPNARQASLAAACANAQGKFWEYYDLLFTERQLDTASLNTYATQLGLNGQQFSDCLVSAQFGNAVDQDFADGAALGVAGTPTYFVNGTKIEGVVGADVWDDVIVSQLQTAQQGTP